MRRFRTAAGLSQEALAERAGLSTDAVAALEQGRRTRPRAFTLGLLAEAMRLGAEERAMLVAAVEGRRLWPAAPRRTLPHAPAAMHGGSNGGSASRPRSSTRPRSRCCERAQPGDRGRASRPGSPSPSGRPGRSVSRLHRSGPAGRKSSSPPTVRGAGTTRRRSRVRRSAPCARRGEACEPCRSAAPLRASASFRAGPPSRSRRHSRRSEGRGHQ